MRSIVTPANIVAGALVSQVSIVLIMTVAALIIRRNWRLTRWIHAMPTYSGFSWQILVLLLVTIAALALSEELAATWRPLFGALGFRGISWSTAVGFVFFADVVALTLLVAGTGGSVSSPFQPLFFLLPTLALLLREPTARVIFYTLLVAASFTALLFRFEHPLPPDDVARHRLAYGVVSVLCLALTCFIGIFTRQH